MMNTEADSSQMMKTIQISDDMIIPLNNRGFNHGCTSFEGGKNWSGRHFRPSNHDTGAVEFGGSCLLGNVGTRMGKSCGTGNLCAVRVSCSANKGEKA